MSEKKKRSGMHGSTAYNWQVKLLSRVQDIYSTAMLFHQTHEHILKRLKEEVYEHPAWSKVPAYVQTYIAGWIKCKADSIYAHHLDWCLSVDGKLLTRKEVDALTNKESQDWALSEESSYRSPRARCDTELSRHVWVDKQGNVLKDRPY